eukprot:jgi/Ulvmu1/5274/UM022_0068.1
MLQHGLSVTDPVARPEPFDLPKHGSCRVPGRAAQAWAVLAEEIEQSVIAEAPPEMRGRCRWFHPLGLIPKGEDKVRIIHDFSAPTGGSINDRIDDVRLGYDKVDAAYAAMWPGCWMAKIDISAVFRHIPLDPADWELIAFRWGGRVYVDTA